MKKKIDVVDIYLLLYIVTKPVGFGPTVDANLT